MILIIVYIFILGYIFSQLFSKRYIHYDVIRRNFIILISLVLILQSGLRHVAIGNDTYAYMLKFEEILKYWSWNDVLNNFVKVYVYNEGKDAGFPLVIKIFQVFSNSYRIFLFFIAIIFFFSLGKLVYKYCFSINDIIFSYLLYLALFYSFFSITGHRQTIATSIVLLAFYNIENRRLFKFIFICILASLIHKSALIFLLVYPLFWIKKFKLLYLFTLIGTILVFLLRSKIINFITYLYYEKNSDLSIGNMPFDFTIFMFLCFLFIIFSILFFKNLDHIKYIGFVNIVSVSFILVPTVGKESYTMRIMQYFTIFFIILLPKLINLYKKNYSIIYYLAIFFLSLIILFHNYDYSFFWEEVLIGENYERQLIISE